MVLENIALYVVTCFYCLLVMDVTVQDFGCHE